MNLSTCVSEQTAHLSFNYPDGFKLKCVRREYVETATKGAKKNEQRVVYQTTHRSWNVLYTEKIAEVGLEAANAWATEWIANGDVRWNAPKGSTYEYVVVMYLDEENHIQHTGIHAYSWAEHFQKFAGTLAKYGVELSDDQKWRLAGLEKSSRRADAEGWAKYDAEKAA